MKPWQLLLLGAAAGLGIYLLYRQLQKKNGTAGFGDFNIPPGLPPWTNVGAVPMGYEPTGWQPHDEWKKFAQRRADLRMRGLGEYIPQVYPMALSPYAMPYQSSLPGPVYDTITWKSPRIEAINVEDQMDAF